MVSFFFSMWGRLWGDHGQTALEESKVCLINASALGTEILKNMVLPGTGQQSVYLVPVFFLYFFFAQFSLCARSLDRGRLLHDCG